MTNQVSENVRRGLETKRMLRQLHEASNIVIALVDALEVIENLNEIIERDETTAMKLADIYETLENIMYEKVDVVNAIEKELIERL